MKTLHMTLIRKWFEQIANGTKTEEYREIKQYWINRLEGNQYDVILFRNGYSKNAPVMQVEFQGLKRKVITWDSGVTEEVFAIQLGRILDIQWNNSEKRQNRKSKIV